MSREAVNNIYVILLILIFLIVNYILIIQNFKVKSSNSIKSVTNTKIPQIMSKYINSVENSLNNLDLPFKLTVKKYLCIKYILSILVFAASYINYKSLGVPLILLVFIFFMPNLLIKSYIKSQNVQLIKELKNINSSMILQLSAFVPFKDALKAAVNNIQDKRIKKHFLKFVYEYEIMGFNIKKPAEKLLTKFKSGELSVFLQVLVQCENEGNIIENLERFNATLELSYFKYLNSQAAKRMTYMIIGTVIMLLNIAILCMYPMLVQMNNSLEMIFS